MAFESENDRRDDAECYFHSLTAELQQKRDRMSIFLQEVGLLPVIPEGGYFMVADYQVLGKSKLTIKQDVLVLH